MPDNPFAAKMSSLSDEQLAAVFEHREDYLPAAIAAAEAELQRRGMSLSDLDQYRLIHREKRAAELREANKPLTFDQKILLMIPVLGIMTYLFMYMNFESRGQNRRAGEMVTWVLIGTGILIALGFFLHFTS